MKKIFTLCAAVLMAWAVQSEPIAPGTGALSAAIGAAEPGAVIELASGDFTESSSIGLSKNLTIKAADGASPIVKSKFGIQGGATVTFEGIKFDASVATEHLIYANDASAENKLIFEGCEFYNYTPNNSLIHVGASENLDACTINNCYIHNINKSFLFNENQSNAFELTITNSTFANVTTVTGSYYAGLIDTRATSGKVRVDQCTFYSIELMSTDYAAIGKVKTNDAVVSNSIFAFPAAASSSYRTIRDKVTANNCLVYNYTADSGYGMQGDVTKNNCIKDQDPLFTDAANGDFSLAETSPAHEAGVGGTHLGDPRWWPASWQPASIVEVTSVELDKDVLSVEVDDVELLTATVSPDDATDPSVSWSSNATANATVSAGLVSGIAAGSATITATAGEKSATCAVTVTAAVVPDVDFSAPCVLMGRKAHLEGAIWKMWKDDTYKLYGEGGSNKNYGTASWTINVTRPCVVSGVLNGVEGGHLYELDLYSGDDLLGYIAHPAAKAWSSSSPLAMDSTDHSTLTFPVAGQYKLVLRNNQEWSSGKVASITLNFIEEIVPAKIEVNTVDLAFTEPKAGEEMPENTIYATDPLFNVIGSALVPPGAGYEITEYTFYNEEGNLPSESTFLPNTTYEVTMLIEPLDGYTFPLNGSSPDINNMSITLNGNVVEKQEIGTGAGIFSVNYHFTTGGIEIKDVEIGVTVPQAGDAVESRIYKGDALFDTFASLVTLPAGANYEIDRFEFFKENGTFVEDNSTLAANTTYRLGINIASKEGYAFPMNDDSSVNLEELNLTVNHNGTSYNPYNGWGYFGITVYFTTSEIPVIAIENVDLTVTFPDYGDAIESGDWYCDECSQQVPMPVVSGNENAYYCKGVDFWSENFGNFEEETLLPNKTYIAQFYVYPKAGYTIPNDLTADKVTVNGEHPQDIDTDAWQDRLIFNVKFTTSEIPTGLNDIEDGEKAVKFIENGQLFIIKNGVKYNAQGAELR